MERVEKLGMPIRVELILFVLTVALLFGSNYLVNHFLVLTEAGSFSWIGTLGTAFVMSLIFHLNKIRIVYTADGVQYETRPIVLSDGKLLWHEVPLVRIRYDLPLFSFKSGSTHLVFNMMHRSGIELTTKKGTTVALGTNDLPGLRRYLTEIGVLVVG